MMKSLFTRFWCLILSLAMILSTVAVLCVSAEGEQYVVGADYDASLGSVELIKEGSTTAELSSVSATTWSASASLTAGETFEMMTGINMTAMENMTYKADAKTFGSNSRKGYVGGSNNPVISNEGATGAVYKIDSSKTGTISIDIKLNASKVVLAAEVGNIDSPILSYQNTETASVFTTVSFDIEAGKSYYFWCAGSKVQVYGSSFEEKLAIKAGEGDTVKIKSIPNANALLGNVKLDDETIVLTKNEDMTECSFTMPAKAVNATVSFVSNAVISEIQALTFNDIKGDNLSATQVDSDLELYDGKNTSIGYADVAWESSNENVVSKSGIVNPEKSDVNVDFTAIFSYQDYPNITIRKTFSITVLADTDDVSAVAAAKEALTLGDTSAIKKDIELSTSGKKNTNISWVSSDDSIVDSNGKVTRYPLTDKTVKLTATISRGDAKDTKEFTVTVLGYVAVTIDRVALSNVDGDVIMEPVEGSHVSHIAYTDSIPNKTGNETLVAAVYSKDGSKLKSCKMYSLLENTTTVGEQTILYPSEEDLPVDSDSMIKVFALSSLDDVQPIMSETYVYENSITACPTIYVAGDSTACEYPQTGSGNRFPQMGWAQALQNYFPKSQAAVSNKAMSGRSSLSFRTEANYKYIVSNIKAGDYFIIQFGHNDSKGGDTTRYTDPRGDRFTEGSYKNSLMNYINAAWDKGAYPLLTTSISRRKTSDASLELYVNATKELGKELGIPVIDLYAKVNSYINDVNTRDGNIEATKDLYNYVKANDSRFMSLSSGEFSKSQYLTGTTDDTHINLYGANMMAQWACDEMVRIGHPLATKRNSKVMTPNDIPSYADATSVN